MDFIQVGIMFLEDWRCIWLAGKTNGKNMGTYLEC